MSPERPFSTSAVSAMLLIGSCCLLSQWVLGGVANVWEMFFSILKNGWPGALLFFS